MSGDGPQLGGADVVDKEAGSLFIQMWRHQAHERDIYQMLDIASMITVMIATWKCQMRDLKGMVSGIYIASQKDVKF